MDFTFTEEQKKWRQEVRDFLDKEYTEDVLFRLIEEQGYSNPHSPEIYNKMAERGFFGLSWPKEYGGQERSHLDVAIFNEECGRSYIPFGTLNAYINSVFFLGGALIAYGTDEQKQHFLPKIVSGEVTSCQGLSEPNVGSDLASVELRAVEDGDDYVLNGQKIFNNAYNVNHIFTVTRTNPDVPKHKGITLFLTDLRSPGITIRPLVTLGNQRRNEVSFDDVRVPKTNLLGQLNNGWYNIASTMDLERSGISRPAELRRDFQELLSFVKQVRYRGKPLSQIPAIRYTLSDIALEIQTAWLLCYRVAWRQSQHLDVGSKEASMAKVYSDEISQRFANRAMDILGQYGQLEWSGDARRWAPLKGMIAERYRASGGETIAAGTAEIQRNIIATRGLGLPR